MTSTAYRVVQWTTGNVGKSSVRALAAHPDIELVGCFAWSPDKAGRDIGELAGIAPIGVAATGDIDALLSLKPDCVVYNPMWPDVEELTRILSSGANVVTSASFITGHNLPPADRERLEQACTQGGSSMFGSGVSPGFAELLAIVAANACDRVDRITIAESSDTTFYDSPDTEKPAGFGMRIDDPDLPGAGARGTAVFAEAVQLVAGALGTELDEITCVSEYAQTTEDLDLGSWVIEKGCVAGAFIRWQGRVGEETVIELSFRWRKGQSLQPDWQLEREGWRVTVEGRPTVDMTVGFAPPPDFRADTIADYMVLGHIMTAMPPIHAIPAVVGARPGIVTYNDLTLPLPRGILGTR